MDSVLNTQNLINFSGILSHQVIWFEEVYCARIDFM